MNRNTILIGTGIIAAVAAFAFLQIKSPETANPAAKNGAIVAVKVPPTDGNTAIGQRIFETACASCHGTNATGIEGTGPPLVHAIYEPGHHGDESFQRAVAGGVRSHHWRFGNMLPVDGLTRGDVAMIITYIRELQRANGIN